VKRFLYAVNRIKYLKGYEGDVMMFIRKLIHLVKPPCYKCPVKLGRMIFCKSPCPRCKLDNYKWYYDRDKNRRCTNSILPNRRWQA